MARILNCAGIVDPRNGTATLAKALSSPHFVISAAGSEKDAKLARLIHNLRHLTRLNRFIFVDYPNQDDKVALPVTPGPPDPVEIV